MEKISLKFITACLALLFSSAVLAGAPQWNYIEGHYMTGDTSDDDSENTYGVRGSVAFDELFHAGLSYGMGENESDSGDFDIYDIRIGVHPEINENSDLVLELFYSNVDWDDDDNVDFYGVVFGVRSLWSDVFEFMVNATLAVEDESGDDDTSDEIYFTVGGRYLFSDVISVGVTLINQNPLLDDSDNTLTFDFRWGFGDI